MSPPTPLLLLKTRSTPHDAYSTRFTPPPYAPTFVPVLEHRHNTQNLSLARTHLLNSTYGGLIFTSQRAVEGFAYILQQSQSQETVRSTARYLSHLTIPNTNTISSSSPNPPLHPPLRRRPCHLQDPNHPPRCPPPQLRSPGPGSGEWREASALYNRAL